MKKIKIPKDMDDAKALGTVLSKYKNTYYSQVLVAYFATYVLYPLNCEKKTQIATVLVLSDNINMYYSTWTILKHISHFSMGRNSAYFTSIILAHFEKFFKKEAWSCYYLSQLKFIVKLSIKQKQLHVYLKLPHCCGIFIIETELNIKILF